MNVVRPVIASNGVPYLQKSSVGTHSTSGRKEDGRKERTGSEWNTPPYNVASRSDAIGYILASIRSEAEPKR